MKIHKLVDVLGAINDTGKLACDMYELGKKHYYSEAQGQKIPVSEMDFQHLVRAFVKLCEQEDMLDRSEHMGTTKDLVAKIEKLDSIVNEKDDYIDHLREKVKGLEDTVQHWYTKYNGLEDSSKTKGHRYVFCEIPNDEYGKKLTRGMKVYLNNESYTMRVRGQHLKKELYGQGKAYHGANIEDCTHLRVYIDAI
tara:strand:+ start:2088 stop:2672 length:585 start_codon:yes stop_codon:yes gene_type:complete